MSGWTYKKPTHLIVRDGMGNPAKFPITEIPEDLHPMVWFVDGRATWQANKFVTKRIVLAYLTREELTEKELKRLATYIVSYTQHIAIMGWMFNSNRTERNESYQMNAQIIRQLKEIHVREPFMLEYVTEMIGACMEIGVDPF